VAVEIAAAGDRTLAPDVQGGERVELSGIALARDHPVLLLHSSVRRGGVHPAEFERRPFVFAEIGKDRGGLDGLGGKAQRRRRPHRTRRFGDRRAVFGNEHARDPVIGPRAVDVVPNHRDAARPPGPDRLVQFVYRRLFEAKRLVLSCHDSRPCLPALPYSGCPLPAMETILAAG